MELGNSPTGPAPAMQRGAAQHDSTHIHPRDSDALRGHDLFFGHSILYSGASDSSSGKRQRKISEEGKNLGDDPKAAKTHVKSSYKPKSSMNADDECMYGCDDEADDESADEDRSQDANNNNNFTKSPLLLPKEGASVGSSSNGANNRCYDKKRQDRNFREKERTSKISKQIEELKQLLDASGVKVKSSKYGVLAGASEYILRLQEQYEKMDTEIKAIAEFSVSKGVVARGADVIDPATIDEAIDMPCASKYVLLDSTTLEYDSAFHSAPMPLGITTLEGKFIDCNDVFLSATRQPKETFLRYPLWEFIDESSRRETVSRLDALYRLEPSAIKGTCMVAHVKSRLKLAANGCLLYFTIFVIRDEETREPRFLSIFVTRDDVATAPNGPHLSTVLTGAPSPRADRPN